eukprot:scaffold2.g6854.t1
MQLVLSTSLRGAAVAAKAPQAQGRQSRRAVVIRASDAPAAPAPWSPPKLDPSTPSPLFGGSTGGLLRQAQVEEFHGPNLLKLARKEQTLALLTQLRTKFKIDGFIYRVFPNGEVQYLHPKDGVYPEKVNAGRSAANTNARRIGQNVSFGQIKFTGKAPADL